MSGNPLIVRHDKTIILPPQLAPSGPYYAIMAAYGHAIIDDTLRYDKRRKSTHRYTVAGQTGPARLTVPVNTQFKSESRTWADVRVSDHGRWPQVHIDTLATVYGHTPFFEYYADDLRSILTASSQRVTELCADLDFWMRRMLGIPTEVTHNTGFLETTPDMDDARMISFDSIIPASTVNSDGIDTQLSALHILFNFGPESPLKIKEMQAASLSLLTCVEKCVER